MFMLTLANLEDRFAKSKTVPGTRSSYHFGPISCNKIAHKLTSQDRQFIQFDFDKSLTEEIDINNIDIVFRMSAVSFRRVDIVTEVNVHEGDLKIKFRPLHGPSKTFSWPSVADKCFVPASNILCVIRAPTITGRMYRISNTDFEQTLKVYENHKMLTCIYKSVVRIWSFLSLVCFCFFFSKFLITHKKMLGVKLEFEITLPLRLSRGSFFLNF